MIGVVSHNHAPFFKLIDRTKANSVMLLSGNVHFAKIWRTDTPAYPLLEVSSSGMTNIDFQYAHADNPSRLARPMTDLNSDFVEIDWSAEPAPCVPLKAIGLDGEVDFNRSVSLDQLRQLSDNAHGTD